MKYLFVLLGLAAMLACNSHNSETSSTKPRILPQDTLTGVDQLNYLVRLRTATDTFRKYHPAATTVWVKEFNEDAMVLVKDRQWPEGIQSTFNVVRNDSNFIILISEYPYSETGDWYLEISHYFDVNGRTYAVERQTNFYNGKCADVVYEQIVKYYDPDFKQLDYSYLLTDAQGHLLDPDSCIFPYNFDLVSDTSLQSYAKGFKEQLLGYTPWQGDELEED